MISDPEIRARQEQTVKVKYAQVYLSSFDYVYLEEKPFEFKIERKIPDKSVKKGVDEQ